MRDGGKFRLILTLTLKPHTPLFFLLWFLAVRWLLNIPLASRHCGNISFNSVTIPPVAKRLYKRTLASDNRCYKNVFIGCENFLYCWRKPTLYLICLLPYEMSYHSKEIWSTSGEINFHSQLYLTPVGYNPSFA